MIEELEAARGGEDIISAQQGARTRELWEARGSITMRQGFRRGECGALEDQLVEKMVQLSEANEEPCGLGVEETLMWMLRMMR